MHVLPGEIALDMIYLPFHQNQEIALKLSRLLVVATICVLPCFSVAAEDPAEVATVIAAVKATNQDMRALCQGGPDGTRKAVTAAIMSLVGQGKIKGNPQAIGAEAGQKIGGECRGG